MARCVAPPKCIGRALKRAHREGGEELRNASVADRLCVSQGFRSLLSCCCASRSHIVKLSRTRSYYWDRGTALYAGFTGTKSISWIHDGT